MSRTTPFLAIAAIAFVSLTNTRTVSAADEAQITRGKYLVGITGCNDCHTPGYFFGKPDSARYLGGSDVGLEIPKVGVFVGPNLTPDKETGLGKWSTQQIVTAMTKGVRPDGRTLAPLMPYMAFSKLTADDASAIAAYLQSLPPVKNKVPGPFLGDQKPTVFVFRLTPPEKPVARN